MSDIIPLREEEISNIDKIFLVFGLSVDTWQHGCLSGRGAAPYADIRAHSMLTKTWLFLALVNNTLLKTIVNLRFLSVDAPN